VEAVRVYKGNYEEDRMKRTVTEEREFCDNCESGGAWYRCLKCGKVFCHDCKEKKGVEYNYAVHFQGSGDGFYCFECDAELRASGTDAVHSAYMEIAKLKTESQEFYATFEAKRTIAEKNLEKIR
jgi:hypothetical protein